LTWPAFEKGRWTDAFFTCVNQSSAILDRHVLDFLGITSTYRQPIGANEGLRDREKAQDGDTCKVRGGAGVDEAEDLYVALGTAEGVRQGEGGYLPAGERRIGEDEKGEDSAGSGMQLDLGQKQCTSWL
jgi:hypothetical protein